MHALIQALLLLVSLAAPRSGATADRARALVERTIANQHKDDAAIYDYERVERKVVFKGGSISSDETYRLVPTGTGHLSLLLRRGNKPVGMTRYRKELKNWESVLEHAIDPNDPREQHSERVQRRRDRKRAKLIDAIGNAYHFTWLGEKMVDGRTLVHIALDPNPAFQPTSRETEMLAHARATVWIDEQAAQLVSGRAVITSSFSAGIGLFSEIDSGGWFEIEQREVAPGLWLPTRTEYSVHGRLLVFPFSDHKLTETGRYRYVGTPDQALALARKEIRNGKMFQGDS